MRLGKLLLLFILLFTGMLFFSPFIMDNCYAEENAVPEPYSPEEFPQWAHDLRRAEILLIGSFPITFLFSTIGYDLIRFAANGFDRNYAPSILNNPTAVPLTNGEKLGVILTSVGLSAIIAVVDLIIGKSTPDIGKAE